MLDCLVALLGDSGAERVAEGVAIVGVHALKEKGIVKEVCGPVAEQLLRTPAGERQLQPPGLRGPPEGVVDAPDELAVALVAGDAKRRLANLVLARFGLAQPSLVALGLALMPPEVGEDPDLRANRVDIERLEGLDVAELCKRIAASYARSDGSRPSSGAPGVLRGWIPTLGPICFSAGGPLRDVRQPPCRARGGAAPGRTQSIVVNWYAGSGAFSPETIEERSRPASAAYTSSMGVIGGA